MNDHVLTTGWFIVFGIDFIVHGIYQAVPKLVHNAKGKLPRVEQPREAVEVRKVEEQRTKENAFNDGLDGFEANCIQGFFQSLYNKYFIWKGDVRYDTCKSRSRKLTPITSTAHCCT